MAPSTHLAAGRPHKTKVNYQDFRFFLKNSIVLSQASFAAPRVVALRFESLLNVLRARIDLVIVDFVVFLHRRFGVRNALLMFGSFSP